MAEDDRPIDIETAVARARYTRRRGREGTMEDCDTFCIAALELLRDFRYQEALEVAGAAYHVVKMNKFENRHDDALQILAYVVNAVPTSSYKLSPALAAALASESQELAFAEGAKSADIAKHKERWVGCMSVLTKPVSVIHNPPKLNPTNRLLASTICMRALTLITGREASEPGRAFGQTLKDTMKVVLG